MKIDFNSLTKAVEEMILEKGQLYVEECIKGMLSLKQIDLNEYYKLMEIIYD